MIVSIKQNVRPNLEMLATKILLEIFNHFMWKFKRQALVHYSFKTILVIICIA